MNIREELERVTVEAFEDPSIAVGEKEFRSAVKRALRKAAIFSPQVVESIGDELTINELLRRAVFEKELLRCAFVHGVDNHDLLGRIVETAYDEAAIVSRDHLRQHVKEALEGQGIAFADAIADDLRLAFVIPETETLQDAISPRVMREMEVRQQLLQMCYEAVVDSFGRDKAARQAEEFVILFLGPPSTEGDSESLSVLEAIGDEIAVLMKSVENPAAKQNALIAIRKVLSAHARPNIDAYLFVKLLNVHGNRFLSTVQDALLNCAGKNDRGEQGDIYLQI